MTRMVIEPLATWQQRVESQGLNWDLVRGLFDEITAREQSKREWKWTVRGYVFYAYGTGQRFKTRYRRALSDGDYDSVPGFDEVAASAWEYLGKEFDCQELWDLVKQPIDRLPTRHERMTMAISESETLAEVDNGPEPPTDDVPF